MLSQPGRSLAHFRILGFVQHTYPRENRTTRVSETSVATLSIMKEKYRYARIEEEREKGKKERNEKIRVRYGTPIKWRGTWDAPREHRYSIEITIMPRRGRP